MMHWARMNRRTLFSLASLALLTLGACTYPQPSSETRPLGDDVLSASLRREALRGQVNFANHIKPILETKCAMCHNQDALPGRMSLANRREAQRSGALRGFIVPGQPEASSLITRTNDAHNGVQAMPPVGERLTRDEIAILRRWIAQGAPWPQGAEGQLKTQSW
jgi:mono/diheme cytochrome c family protein